MQGYRHEYQVKYTWYIARRYFTYAVLVYQVYEVCDYISAVVVGCSAEPELEDKFSPCISLDDMIICILL